MVSCHFLTSRTKTQALLFAARWRPDGGEKHQERGSRLAAERFEGGEKSSNLYGENMGKSHEKLILGYNIYILIYENMGKSQFRTDFGGIPFEQICLEEYEEPVSSNFWRSSWVRVDLRWG